MVWAAVPHSCLLFRMCNVYGENGLLVLMCLMFSRCRTLIYYTVCPTYELLHVQNFDLYIPLEFILFSCILSWRWLYVVLLDRRATFNLVFLNKLLTFCLSGL